MSLFYISLDENTSGLPEYIRKSVEDSTNIINFADCTKNGILCLMLNSQKNISLPVCAVTLSPYFPQNYFLESEMRQIQIQIKNIQMNMIMGQNLRFENVGLINLTIYEIRESEKFLQIYCKALTRLDLKNYTHAFMVTVIRIEEQIAERFGGRLIAEFPFPSDKGKYSLYVIELPKKK